MNSRKDGRVVYAGSLENYHLSDPRVVGSNPTPSAIFWRVGRYWFAALLC